ncbi:MAG: twin-arginine translocation signal domain-containing protein, partial [Actinomycetospora chiangmaiensis]|nr:twin-arginine translocation signal domain-containing protein [Actinomycetospora chiangmaiensis]
MTTRRDALKYSGLALGAGLALPYLSRGAQAQNA